MIVKALKAVFRFVAEAHQERAERYRDFAAESRKLDKYSNDHLIHEMDANQFVSMNDVLEILERLNARKEFRFSRNDFEEHVQPFLNAVQRGVNSGRVACHLKVYEDVMKDGRMRVGDLVDVLMEMHFPSGTEEDPRATEIVYAPAPMEFDENTMLGRFQKRVHETAPLTTPSADVVEQRQESEHHLNVRRPLILAIGLASQYKPKDRIIESEQIPTYLDTKWERDTRKKPPRYYRGTRIDD